MSKKKSSKPENRVVFTKTCVKLFYAEGDKKRSYARLFEQIIQPITGIGESSYGNYRRKPDSIVNENPMPDHLSRMLEQHILLLTHLSPGDTARVQQRIYQMLERLIESTKEGKSKLTADVLLKYLDEMEDNCNERDAR